MIIGVIVVVAAAAAAAAAAAVVAVVVVVVVVVVAVVGFVVVVAVVVAVAVVGAIIGYAPLDTCCIHVLLSLVFCSISPSAHRRFPSPPYTHCDGGLLIGKWFKDVGWDGCRELEGFSFVLACDPVLGFWVGNDPGDDVTKWRYKADVGSSSSSGYFEGFVDADAQAYYLATQGLPLINSKYDPAEAMTMTKQKQCQKTITAMTITYNHDTDNNNEIHANHIQSQS